MRPATWIRRAVISPRVSVPVLSEAMTETLPSVSTAGSRRTSALRFTIRCAPRAREIVTTAGSASGTTATARAIPKITISQNGWPLRIPRTRITATTATAAPARTRPTLSRFSCSGVRRLSTPCSSPAIVPNSVRIPVSTTITDPRP